MHILRAGWRALCGAVVITLAAQGGVACSSGSAGSGNSSGGSSGNGSGGSSGADAGGGSSGSGPSGCNTKVYSHKSQTSDCIESYAPKPPAGFTSGKCATSGLNGCCKQSGPCGFTATCYYNLQTQLVTGAINNCTSMHGSWSPTLP